MVSTICTIVMLIKLEEHSAQSLTSWRPTSGPGMQQLTLVMLQMMVVITTTVTEGVHAKQTCMTWIMMLMGQVITTRLTHLSLFTPGLTFTKKMDNFQDIQ